MARCPRCDCSEVNFHKDSNTLPLLHFPLVDESRKKPSYSGIISSCLETRERVALKRKENAHIFQEHAKQKETFVEINFEFLGRRQVGY